MGECFGMDRETILRTSAKMFGFPFLEESLEEYAQRNVGNIRSILESYNFKNIDSATEMIINRYVELHLERGFSKTLPEFAEEACEKNKEVNEIAFRDELSEIRRIRAKYPNYRDTSNEDIKRIQELKAPFLNFKVYL